MFDTGKEGRVMLFQSVDASIQSKLEILADAAKYDVACTSSGVDRKVGKGDLGNTKACGICHTFSADGRCVSLLKILFTNECIHDCKYCVNRVSNDVPRATFTPDEVCRLTLEFYRRNYIEGLFLSSGIVESPDHTMELICRTLHDLRRVHRFEGYIHCKTIPGADPALVEMAGWYADRMSVNMELPTAAGLKQLAPGKSRKTILTPMRQIQSGMAQSRAELGMKGGNHSAYWYTNRRMGRGRLPGEEIVQGRKELSVLNGVTGVQAGASGIGMESGIDRGIVGNSQERTGSVGLIAREGSYGLTQWNRVDTHRGFVPAGQSTQMIVGATPETDLEIVSVAEALYRQFDLKRVFYSAFVNVNQDTTLPGLTGGPPLKREHRLYQADFLMRYYGFESKELLSRERPNFNVFLDPKCDWALGHLEDFPVEINRADLNTLLRVPGIGPKSARRILRARRSGKVDFADLRPMGVVLKRAVYFITCGGKMMTSGLQMQEDFITRQLLAGDENVRQGYQQDQVSYRQLTLFDDFSVGSQDAGLIQNRGDRL